MKKSLSRALAVGVLVAATSLLATSPAFAAATVSPTTLTTGVYAAASAYNPAGDTVAVAAYGRTGAPNPPLGDPEVDFIDVKTNAVTVLKDAGLTAPTSLAWSPDGATLYVLNADTDIAVIDVATHSVVGNLSSGPSPSPYGMAITPDGNYLLVGDYSSGDDTVIIDIANNTVTSLNYADDYTVGVFVSPDGTKAYVVDYYGVVNVFDLSTPLAAPIQTLQFDGMSYGGTSVCSNFDMTSLYMIDYNEAPFDSFASRIDLATGASVSVSTKMGESIGCNVTPDGKNLLVASSGGDYPGVVGEFDGTTMELLNTYATSATDYTDVIASSPKNCDVYVSNFEPSTNILSFPCDAALPNTGVDTMATVTAGAFGLLALSAGAFVLIARRRKA